MLLVVEPVQELDKLLDDHGREAEQARRSRAPRLGHQRATDRDHLLLAPPEVRIGNSVAPSSCSRKQGVDTLETLARFSARRRR